MKSALGEFELFAITSITHLSTLVYHIVLPKSAFLECVLAVVPQYLAIVFLKHLGFVYGSLLGVLGIYLLATQIWKRKSEGSIWPGNVSKDAKQSDSEPKSEKVYVSVAIDRTRVLVIACVAVAIFASDFPFYDGDKLGKSMGPGLKLMDIGVGSFVYNAGFFSTKASPQRKMKNALLSFFFGMLRSLSKVLFELGVDDAEFGVHLNFFFILGVLNLISLVINTPMNFFIGFAMCAFHELLLNFAGLETLIYSTERSNLLAANIEGIAFILPQMGMFLMASEISRVVFSKRPLGIVVLYDVFFAAVLSVARSYSLSCRRVHNLYFCMIIMVLHTTHGIGFEMVSRAFKIKSLQVHRFTSKHLLFVLLWSNILVEANKALLGSRSMSDGLSHGLCITYLVLVFYVPYTIARRSIGILSRQMA